MTSSATYNEELEAIEVSYSGSLTADEIMQTSVVAAALAKEHDTLKYIIDTTDFISAPVTAIYELVDRQYSKLGISRESSRVVILPRSKQARGSVMFYETVCVNRGWKVKLFPDRQSAVDFLLEDSEPPAGNMDNSANESEAH